MSDTQSIKEMKAGDPRRIVALAQGATDIPKDELLWGCDDPKESLRMADIIVNGGFLAITLNERGSNGFTYLEEERRVAGVRAPYFIDAFNMGAISGGPMLLGQFLFELMNDPESALLMMPGATNRVYFRMDGTQDRRVQSYDFLSDEEVRIVREELRCLTEQHPKHQQVIDRMHNSLGK